MVLYKYRDEGGRKMTFAVVALLFIGSTLIGVAKFLNWLEEGGY